MSNVEDEARRTKGGNENHEKNLIVDETLPCLTNHEDTAHHQSHESSQETLETSTTFDSQTNETSESSPNRQRLSRARRVGKVPPLSPVNISDQVQDVKKSKHDEKWDIMFEKLVEYRRLHGDTMVPQCYYGAPRLGRWVHYQRVEYWIFQSRGKAKISSERISRLNMIGFEWDPQQAQWETMYQKLEAFKDTYSHCNVSKGFRDRELANWVRNQRLEFTNLHRGKKSRMTESRRERLESLGFKWSNSKYYGSFEAGGKLMPSNRIIGTNTNMTEHALRGKNVEVNQVLDPDDAYRFCSSVREVTASPVQDPQDTYQYSFQHQA